MYTVTKEIQLSYGHRIASHGSKCKSPHGHTGTIAATVGSAKLVQSGEQADMVVDFAHLRDLLMTTVFDCIDHGFVAAVSDAEVLRMFYDPACKHPFEVWQQLLQEDVDSKGFSFPKDTLGKYKLYVVQHAPTAERLAEHFFHRLQKPVAAIAEGAQLVSIRFSETPSSFATYPQK